MARLIVKHLLSDDVLFDGEFKSIKKAKEYIMEKFFDRTNIKYIIDGSKHSKWRRL